jgi:quercetin dioxygenase-like cupin family protein
MLAAMSVHNATRKISSFGPSNVYSRAPSIAKDANGVILMAGTDITAHPIHLGLGASAEIEPYFTGEMDWYTGYVERHDDEGSDGRLVSMQTIRESRDVWEMHPQGTEVVLCTAGSIVLCQEDANGHVETVSLGAGQYAIIEPGTWHTADVENEATVLFITSGLGTQHRPR